MKTIKFREGHKVTFSPKGVVVEDDDGDRRCVNIAQPIRAGKYFQIPVIGGCVTTAPADEAFTIAAQMGMEIVAEGRRFRVEEI